MRQIGVLAFLLLMLTPTSTRAQVSDLRTEEARRLYELGVIAFEEEQWPACAEYFERSFALVSAPELLFNVGRCYGRSGDASGDVEDLRRAVAALSRYLRELPEASDRAVTETEIATLQARIGQLFEVTEAAERAELALEFDASGLVATPVEAAAAAADHDVHDVRDELLVTPADSDDTALIVGLVAGGVVLVTVAVILGVVLGTSSGSIEPFHGTLMPGSIVLP
jgi:hypothetical protein